MLRMLFQPRFHCDYSHGKRTDAYGNFTNKQTKIYVFIIAECMFTSDSLKHLSIIQILQGLQMYLIDVDIMFVF